MSALAIALSALLTGCFVVFTDPAFQQAPIGQEVSVTITVLWFEPVSFTPVEDGTEVFVQVTDEGRAETATPSSQTLFTVDGQVTFTYTNTIPGIDTITVPLINGEPWEDGGIFDLSIDQQVGILQEDGLTDGIDDIPDDFFPSLPPLDDYPAIVEWTAPVSIPNTQVAARNQVGGPTLSLQAG